MDKNGDYLKEGANTSHSPNQENTAMTDENVASFPPPKPTVPVYRVVERIVNQTLDAVEAREASETPELQSFVKAVADVINQHPAHLNIVSWLAAHGLEHMFCSAAVERGIDYAVGVGSPEVEATEEDLNYVPPED
jgi:hypothetical protein